jgi:enoyl-CoA hydratase
MASEAAAGQEPEVVCSRRGVAGHILLNRPQALNAVNLAMVRTIHAALDDWAQDPAVTRIVIEGAGGKAFCAGGDIRTLHDLGKAGRVDEARAFWREEYELNIRIKANPKPFIALVDGIVMGGGVGLSILGSHRVAGERWLFAMPEVGIGFFPDVGATWFLPRLPGATGRWIALTGTRLKQGDSLALGLATHAVPSAAFADLRDALCTGEEVDDAIARHALPARPLPALSAQDRDIVDRCFAAPDALAILAGLDREAAAGSTFAAETAATIRSRSPNSVAIALEQIRRGSSLSFPEAMRLEFRIASRIPQTPDFFEGVRAVVIDKDQKPRWSPATLEAVTPDDTARYFAPLPDELVGDGQR